eukprot:1043213_1
MATTLTKFESIRSFGEQSRHHQATGKLQSIRGNTILDINVCTWSQAVLRALLAKIVDNAEEMGAFMKNGLSWYLVDGPSYTGYDNVIMNKSTRVAFTVVTPPPSQTWKSTDTPLHRPHDKQSGDHAGATVGIIAVIFVCICLLIIVWFWYQKNMKVKRELAETKQRVVDLEALTGVEGDGAGLDNIAPEE